MKWFCERSFMCRTSKWKSIWIENSSFILHWADVLVPVHSLLKSMLSNSRSLFLTIGTTRVWIDLIHWWSCRNSNLSYREAFECKIRSVDVDFWSNVNLFQQQLRRQRQLRVERHQPALRQLVWPRRQHQRVPPVQAHQQLLQPPERRQQQQLHVCIQKFLSILLREHFHGL